MKAYANTIITKEQHEKLEAWIKVRTDYVDNPEVRIVEEESGILWWKRKKKLHNLINVPSCVKTHVLGTYAEEPNWDGLIELNNGMHKLISVSLMSKDEKPVFLDDEMYSLVALICGDLV